MSPDKEFMSLEQVADLLGVNYQLIYKLVRSGELPAARIGKVYRVSRADLDSYISQTKTTAGATCSSCGQTYQNTASLNQKCKVCGEPICFDCWNRLKVRHCEEHKETTSKK